MSSMTSLVESNGIRELATHLYHAAFQRHTIGWNRIVRRFRVVGKSKLEPCDIVPPPKLESDSAIDADWHKAQRLMETHARRIGQGNACVGVHIPLPLQHVEQRAIEGSRH